MTSHIQERDRSQNEFIKRALYFMYLIAFINEQEECGVGAVMRALWASAFQEVNAVSLAN
jgi:hypothetical protein